MFKTTQVRDQFSLIYSIKYYKFLSITLFGIFSFFYLIVTQVLYLSFDESLEFNFIILDSWLNKIFKLRAFPNFEAIGYISFSIFDISFFLLLPIPNLIFTFAISFLMSLNLTLSVFSIFSPLYCKINPVTGLLSSLPAFLTGFACCAPVFLLSLSSVVASSVLLDLLVWFPLFLPVAFFLLILSLYWSVSRLQINSNLEFEINNEAIL